MSGSSPATSTTGWSSGPGRRDGQTRDPTPDQNQDQNADEDIARRAWRGMSEIALDRDRKVAVSHALGMSWTRVLALRRLAIEPHTLRALAESLSADPPYVTLMIDDLEKRGLLTRKPHPRDRRAKLVELTVAGRVAAARADAILDEPPAALREVAAEDLAALVRVVERLRR